jgi:hypothetical protein
MIKIGWYLPKFRILILLCVAIVFLDPAILIAGPMVKIPGADVTDRLTAAGTLLRIVDSFLFVFGARIMAGLAVLGAGWNLKEQRFAMAIICIIAAILIGTVPLWIKNIFEIGGGTIFS